MDDTNKDKTGPGRWRLRSTTSGPDGHDLREWLLGSGWEPFAVTEKSVWFRKHTTVDDTGARSGRDVEDEIAALVEDAAERVEQVVERVAETAARSLRQFASWAQGAADNAVGGGKPKP